jgi:uncharacterized DUF497 family protein
MAFIWDPQKEDENYLKHGLHFATAEHIFGDPFRIKRRDDDSSRTENRYQSIGKAGTILFVVYTEESADDTRIISARLATAKERRIYHDRTGTTYPYGWEWADP